MRVLGVGIATLDIVNTVDGYPEEDAEVRAAAQRMSRGGNATNTLVTLSQLGHDCSWAGMLATDVASDWVRQDLQRFQVNIDAVAISNGSLPTSYVTLNSRNGSRTIVHYRDLDEFSYEDFRAIDVSAYDWIHFEGRHVPALGQMMHSLVERNYKNFSLEVEKPRQDIEQLFALPALLMFSRAYVRETHQGSIKVFFHSLRDAGVEKSVYCAWGKAGAWAMDNQGRLFQRPAWQPEQVIDTLGAGDVFNAAVIHATLKNEKVEEALEFSCRLAGVKCGLQGFDHLDEALRK